MTLSWFSRLFAARWSLILIRLGHVLIILQRAEAHSYLTVCVALRAILMRERRVHNVDTILLLLPVSAGPLYSNEAQICLLFC